MAIDVYMIDNDNMIRIDGIQDGLNLNYLNNIPVEVTVVDAATDTPISGQTWPAPMTYIGGSNGSYFAVLEFDLIVSEQQLLHAKVVANGGSGLRLSIRRPLRALYREGP